VEVSADETVAVVVGGIAEPLGSRAEVVRERGE